MLIFSRFRGTNAGPFKNFDLNFNKQGLVRVKGKNGQGKSTIFHLLTQLCYSQTPNSAKKSDLMKDESNYLLELTFQKNGSTYIAAQAVKSRSKAPNGMTYSTGVYLFRDEEDISLHKDPDTQKLIRQTLGWSLEEWYGYVYLAQATTHTLIEGTRSERQQYLSALFNLSPLDTLAKYFKDKEVELQEKIGDLEKLKQEHAIKTSLLGNRNLATFENTAFELQTDIDILKDRLIVLKEQEAKHQRYIELDAKYQAIPESRLPLEELDSALIEAKQGQAQYDSALLIKASTEKKLNSLVEPEQAEIPEDYDSIIESPDIDEPGVKKELQRLLDIESGLEEQFPIEEPEDFGFVLASPDIDARKLQREIQTIETRPAPPEQNLDKTLEEISGISESIQELKAEILDGEKELKTLKFSGSKCNTCGTVLDCADRQQKAEALEESIAGLKVVLGKQEKKLLQLKEIDKAWRGYQALGPDRTEELPELRSALVQFQKKQKYLLLKKEQEAYEQYLSQKTEIEKIAPLRNQLKLFQKKKSYRLLKDKKERYGRYLSEKSSLQVELDNLVIPESRKEEIGGLEKEISREKERQGYQKEMGKLRTVGGPPTPQDHKITNIEKELGDLQTNLGGVNREILEVRGLQGEIQGLQEKISQDAGLYPKQKLYSILAKGYGKAGQLRELQLARFSEYLEQALLGHTIRQLPQHRFKIVVDDGIDIMAMKDGGKPYDIKFMSGGEKGALSVAFLFALDDLLPPDRRSNLKILDEIEAGFDQERKSDFIEFTLPQLRSRAETVMVISHSEAANQNVFDKVLEIKDGEILDSTQEVRAFS